MRATSETMGTKDQTSSLEAEAAAWCSKRGRRPVSVTGKVPVVRIRRRAGPGSSTVRSRPLRVSENPQARQGLIRRKQAQRTPAANSESRLRMAYVIVFWACGPFPNIPDRGTM